MFGKWLLDRLKSLGLTQETAAHALGRERSFIQRLAGEKQALRVDEVATLATTLKVRKTELLAACGLDLSDEIQTGADLGIMKACLEEFVSACQSGGVRLDRAKPEQVSRTVLYLYDRAIQRSRVELQQLAHDIVSYESAPGGSLPTDKT